MPSARAAALLQGLLVTALWSSSWVLIKIGLHDLQLGPFSFAGLRYGLAAAVLLPFALRRLEQACGWWRDARLVGGVVGLGVLFYAATQGAQFVALGLLPAAALSLLLSSTPLFVALLGLAAPRERPSALQVVGVALLAAGALVYFGVADLGHAGPAGLTVGLLGALTNAASAVLGRRLSRQAEVRLGGVVPLTALSMAVGAVLLLAAGLILEGPPHLGARSWLVVAWLALVNTAFAFTLWNHTLRTLTALESSVLNGTMLVQIAALAWLFLGEALTVAEIAGLTLASTGVLLVQLRSIGRSTSPRSASS
ncbi:MAG TPA: DMT family transporter [Chloroflexota bacterium]|nr:DMT family transporter [Chloroflexota bacterium]